MSTPAVVKAKRFLVNRIVDQAKRENVALSDIEIRMLGFARVSATPRELEAAAAFERDYSNEQYEAKIGKLIRNVYKLDKEAGKAGIWEQSLDAVADEDVYLALILKKLGIREPAQTPWYMPDRRSMRELVPTIVLVVIGIVVIFTPLGTMLIPNPILRTVVGLCFWIAPLMVRKLMQESVE